MSTPINIAETLIVIKAIKSQLAALEESLAQHMPKEEVKEEKAKKAKKVMKAAEHSEPTKDLPLAPTAVPERLMTMPEPEKKEKEKVKRAPSKWVIALQEVYMPTIKKALGEEKLPKGMTYMQVASYLNSNKITEPDVDDVLAGIEFLESNPDHKSDRQKTLSENSSSDGEASAAKKRGRPKKVKAEAVNPFDEM